MAPPKGPSPKPSKPKPGGTQGVVRLIIVVAAVSVAGLWLVAMNRAATTLDLTLVNRTGGALTKVTFGAPGGTGTITLDTLASGETARGTVPAANEVPLKFVGPDGRSRHETFQFSASGMRHQMRITLLPPGPATMNSKSTSSLLDGATVERELPYDMAIED